ncbi:hypothetical protein [Acinetobacter sp. HR7]|uniref:hypothetical protein n=1 Tax=Acinetobacter sp. HR7 TaxID=1509403 RepID=UPI0005367781|nr:hypothetical protein [Acinetobacter sp. HR7]KGT48071.1 hypothetical protein GW12_09030 [Acinetobacter sp. HR7]
MKNILTMGAALATALALTACSSNPTNTTAIQKENNQFEVTGLGKTQVIAKNNAVNAASKTCGSRATPIIVDEQSTYDGALKGVVDEQTGQMIQAAAKVLGNIAGTGNNINSDDDYQTTLTFRCQSN